MRFVIITGLSGAGKSQTVKYMEDLGFYCVDNMPPALIPKFAEICFESGSKIDRIALVIDIRGRELFNDLIPALITLKEQGLPYEILFLEASDNVLVKRFKESRRMHPLAQEGRLIKGINEERDILEDVRKRANHIIDSSELTLKQLKEKITAVFSEIKELKGIVINIISFGFKYGIPMECDLVFDVRFIPNPFYISSLKRFTGKHESVRKYVCQAKETIEFLVKLNDMLDFLIPNYVKEGKPQLVIGIGCTGGRHRSVAIADKLGLDLIAKKHRVIVEHRDIDKDNRGADK